jgi:uncharacterized protein (TIGR03437 family)
MISAALNKEMGMRLYRTAEVRPFTVLLIATGLICEGTGSAQSLGLIRDFPDSDANETVRRMASDDSAMYVVGTRHLSGDPVAGVGGGPSDGFLRKFDRNGNQLWIRRFGAAATEMVDVAVTGNGIYIAGYVAGALPGQAPLGAWDAFLRKYDFDGSEIWTRQFGTSNRDFAAGVTSDGTNIYIIGQMGAADYGSLGETYVSKYDPNGSLLWTRRISDSYFNAVAADSSGVYISGFVSSTFSAGRGFLRKLTDGGDDLWTQSINGTSIPESLWAGFGGVYVGTSDPATLAKYGAGGDELWSRGLAPGIRAAFTSFVKSDGSSVYAAGTLDGILPGQCRAGSRDNFVQRFDPEGREIWARQFGTPGPDGIGGIAPGNSRLYLAWQRNRPALATLNEDLPASSDRMKPRIRFDCVVNAASFESGGIAPGEIVSILGTGLGPGTPAAGMSGGPAPSSLAATRVLFDGIPAPVLYASETMTTAIVPYGIAGVASVGIQVEYQGRQSDTVQIPVADSRPGLFALNSAGTGQAVAFNEDGTPNSGANPATSGSTITLYATGVGVIDSPEPDGSIVQDTQPRPKAPAAVLFFSEDGDVFKNPVLEIRGVSGSVLGLFQAKVKLPPIPFRSWTARLEMGAEALAPIGWESSSAVTVAAR